MARRKKLTDPLAAAFSDSRTLQKRAIRAAPGAQLVEWLVVLTADITRREDIGRPMPKYMTETHKRLVAETVSRAQLD